MQEVTGARRHDEQVMVGVLALLVALLAALVALALIEIPRHPALAFMFYASGFVLLYFLVFRGLPGAPGWLRSSWFILLTAILIRLVYGAVPLSDDVNRYAWEGKIIAEGRNPYLEPPQAFAAQAAGDPIYDGINHPDFPAAYPPLSLLAFRAISGVWYAPGRPPAETLLAFKVFFLLVDVGVLLLLVPLLRYWRRPAWWLALYAWNPLVLLYGVGEGHLDVLQNLLLVIALLAFFRPRPVPGAGFIALGAAIMTKFLSVVLVPFLVKGRQVRWLPLLLLPGLLYVPFLAPGIFDSLMRFSGELHANDLVPRLLRLWLDGPLYRLAMLVVFGGGLVCIWLLKQDAPARAMILAWGWLICCLPTVHPWYLLPMTILLLHTPIRAWYILMMSMGVQFWILHGQWRTGLWIEAEWVWLAMYGPFLVVLAVDFWHRQQPWQPIYPPVKTVDILIPTLNEEENLDACLKSVRQAMDVAGQEVRFALYVIDAGSEDQTVAIAERHGCRILEGGRRGRGNQYAQGVRAGSGQLVLMLHADAIVAPDALHRLVHDCRRYPTVEWGILGHVYTERSWRMRLIELSNRLRFNMAGIAFGDQGIFVQRQVLTAVGGMPEIPLMEDVELSLRLGDAPYRLQVGSSLQVSTRGWQKKSYAGYTLQVLRLCSAYLLLRRLGRSPAALAAAMYRQYYGRSCDASLQEVD